MRMVKHIRIPSKRLFGKLWCYLIPQLISLI